jgi:DNA replication protein DnaC
MDTSTTLQMMHKLKLDGMASSYQAICELPMDKQPDTHQCLATMIDAEVQSRATKRTNMLSRLSKLRYNASLHDIKYSPKRNITKQQMAKLTDCAYLLRGENIVITGATGCGKSYLACALGHQACLYGHRTLYFNMNRFCEQIAIAKVDGTLIKWMNRIRKAQLLILDDFGLQQLSHDVKLTLLQILEDRYKQSSTIITSQLPLKKWHAYINEPTIADAILDRLTAKYSKMELKGKSLRKSA